MNRRTHLSLPAIWYAAGVMLLHITTSCSEDNGLGKPPIQGSFETTAIAGAEQRVNYMVGDSPFTIEVMSIEDSRCPSDVVCVWAGEAQVTFSITGIEQLVDLYLQEGTECKTCSYTFELEGRSYELILVDVTPYPTSENSDSIRKAHFNVRSL